MNKKNISKIVLIISLVFLVFIGVANVHADDGLVPSGGKSDGKYSLNDLVLVAVNVSDWILGIAGSLALLAFVVGGFYMIMAGGNREYVEKGKQSLIAAVVGLVIVFFAYSAIGYFMTALGYDRGTFGEWNVAPVDNGTGSDPSNNIQRDGQGDVRGL